MGLGLTPPTAGILDAPAVCISINADWVNALMTAVERLEFTSTWEDGTDMDFIRGEVIKLNDYLADVFAGSCNAGEPPFWEDTDNVDDEEPNGGIPWYDELGDWFLTGFLAVTFTPAAGIFYKTFVPKARVALRRGDWGALFKVLINGLEYVTGDSYGAVTEILEVDLDIAGFAAANGLGDAPWNLEIVHNGTGASSDPNPRLEVVRKRLDATEVNAITDIFQDQGQLLIQRGNIDIWYNVENADNVRRDGSTVITGQQQWKTGTATGALLKLNPDAGEKAIEVKLPVTTTHDLIRVLNNSSTVLWSINTIGRQTSRGDDNNMYSILAAGGESVLQIGSVAGNPILTLKARTGQSADIFRAQNASALTLVSVGSSGVFSARSTMQQIGATSTQERIMSSMVSTWDVTTDATRRAKVAFNINTWLGTVTPLAMSADNTGVGTLGFFGASPAPQQAVNEGVVDLPLVFLQALQSLKNLGLIKPAGGGAFTFTKQVVTADTGGNQALHELLDGLEAAGLITNNSVSEQSFDGTLTPINGQTSVAWSPPKQVIAGETYTILVNGLISFAGGANGYSDPIAEGAVSNALSSCSGSRGKFSVDGVDMMCTEPVDNTDHSYELDPYFAVTTHTILFRFYDYIADPDGEFEISITGKFAN